MDDYLSRIENVISNVEDKNSRNQLINEYYRIITGEQKRLKIVKIIEKMVKQVVLILKKQLIG
jgi:hypothetical protein